MQSNLSAWGSLRPASQQQQQQLQSRARNAPGNTAYSARPNSSKTASSRAPPQAAVFESTATPQFSVPSNPFSDLVVPSMPLPAVNMSLASTWIFPVSADTQRRDYQLALTQKALFRNLLVCLPTGLGKTFIAAVVMYNFYRWYPTGKVYVIIVLYIFNTLMGH